MRLENASGDLAEWDSEVQERASNLFGLIGLVEERISSSVGDMKELGRMFEAELGPVSQVAQQKVAIPGFNLKHGILQDIKQRFEFVW